MPNRREDTYLISEMLPTGRVHLFAGPSGSGKTSLIFQWAKRWLAGDTVLGQQTCKINPNDAFFYISSDRSENEMRETVRRMGIDPDAPPSGFIAQSCTDIDARAEDFVEKMPPETRICFIEGADVLVEDGGYKSASDVAKFLKKLGKAAEQRDVAIWCAMATPKQKKGEEYLNPRERVSGSGAWGRFASTLFILAQDNPWKINDPDRSLYVFPRNFANKEYAFRQVAHGRYAEVPATETYDIRMKLLLFMAPGTVYQRKTLIAWSESEGFCARTLDRALEGLEEKGDITHEGRGKYIRIADEKLLPPVTEGKKPVGGYDLGI